MTEKMIRPMCLADMAEVLHVQAACYPAHLHESDAVLRAKVAQFAQTCWVAGANDRVRAYLFAHVWAGDLPPAFDSALAIPPGRPYFYLHDMAVHPGWQGQGLSRCLWLQALAAADALACAEIRLVAVAGAQRFWSRLGFSVQESSNPVLVEKLGSYGAQAQLMHYRL